MSLPPTDGPRCGKRFLGEPGSLCEECAAEEAKRRPRGKRLCHYLRVCPHCHREFDTTNARQIFCSPTCRSEYEQRAKETEEENELEVRSEELPAVLRKCSTSGNVEDCIGCPLKNDGNCFDELMQAAADEIERREQERRPTPKITGRHMGTFIEASAIYMTKAGMEGCEYENMADIFDIYEWLRCAKKEEEA